MTDNITATSTHALSAAIQPATWLRPKLECVPVELRARRNWVLWRAEWDAARGKHRKVPYQPNGRPASSTNAATWSSFEEVCAAYRAGSFTGIGFVLDGTADGAGRTLIGLDFDNCIIGSTLAPIVEPIIHGLNCYIEPSPSGKGIRAIGYAPKIGTGINKTIGGYGFEAYSDARYLTITGHGNGGICDIGPQVERLLALLGETRRSPSKAPGATLWSHLPQGLPPLPPDPTYEFGRHSEGVTLAELRDATLHLARVGLMRSEGDWTRVAQGLAAHAASWPELEEEIYAILDEASREGARHD